MAFKFVVITCLVAAASAGVLPAGPVAYQSAVPLAYAPAPAAKLAAPVAYTAPVAKLAVEAYDHNPQYSYSYDVHDGLTGDSKSQHETRNGDVVQGSYSVVDPDGTKRTVEYTADPHNGFNALVHKEPLAVKVTAVAKVAAPVAYSAVPEAHSAGPVLYTAAPVAKVAAPLAYAATPAVQPGSFFHSAPVYHH